MVSISRDVNARINEFKHWARVPRLGILISRPGSMRAFCEPFLVHEYARKRLSNRCTYQTYLLIPLRGSREYLVRKPIEPSRRKTRDGFRDGRIRTRAKFTIIRHRCRVWRIRYSYLWYTNRNSDRPIRNDPVPKWIPGTRVREVSDFHPRRRARWLFVGVFFFFPHDYDLRSNRRDKGSSPTPSGT